MCVCGGGGGGTRHQCTKLHRTRAGHSYSAASGYAVPIMLRPILWHLTMTWYGPNVTAVPSPPARKHVVNSAISNSGLQVHTEHHSGHQRTTTATAITSAGMNAPDADEAGAYGLQVALPCELQRDDLVVVVRLHITARLSRFASHNACTLSRNTPHLCRDAWAG